MEKIEVLFKEYEAISRQIDIDKQRYHQQTNFVNMYLVIIVTLTGGLLLNKGLRVLLVNPSIYLQPCNVCLAARLPIGQ